jgi:hypothetical protein
VPFYLELMKAGTEQRFGFWVFEHDVAIGLAGIPTSEPDKATSGSEGTGQELG